MMRVFAVMMSLALCLLVGCGGGSGSSSPPVSVTISPSSASIIASASQAFTAAVAHTSNTAVTWSVQEGAPGGSITSAGVYTAPATTGTYHVVATSQADTTKTATATVTVNPPVVVAVSPTTATLTAGQSKTFTASVSGTANTAVTWSVQEGASGGAVTSAGVYTAPATAGTYHVVAASQADNTKTAVATVTVHVAVTVSPLTATVTLGQSQTFAAVVTGATNTAVNWSVQEGAAGGSITSAGVYTAPATAGTYHIVATSQADTTQQSVATIIVQSGSASGTIQ